MLTPTFGLFKGQPLGFERSLGQKAANSLEHWKLEPLWSIDVSLFLSVVSFLGESGLDLDLLNLALPRLSKSQISDAPSKQRPWL